MNKEESNEAIAEQIGLLAKDRGIKIASAESCTGGLVGATCTSIDGCSNWFDRGWITYSIKSKQQMLGVSADSLKHYGAVSEPVASEMARGAITHSDANLSVSVTGVAGPAGGDVDCPVGTVWFAWASLDEKEITIQQTSKILIPGDREAIRLAAVKIALTGFRNILEGLPIK